MINLYNSPLAVRIDPEFKFGGLGSESEEDEVVTRNKDGSIDVTIYI